MDGALVGRTIEKIVMKGEPNYSGRIGTIELIDDMGQLHGSWGGCAVILGEDSYRIIDADKCL